MITASFLYSNICQIFTTTAAAALYWITQASFLLSASMRNTYISIAAVKPAAMLESTQRDTAALLLPATRNEALRLASCSTLASCAKLTGQ